MKNSACRPVKEKLPSKGERLTEAPRELTTLETVDTAGMHTEREAEGERSGRQYGRQNRLGHGRKKIAHAIGGYARGLRPLA